MSVFVDVVGKLPAGLVELYCVVDNLAQKFGIRYLVIGAMARDLILYHGFGAALERGTRDVDFAIQVATWDEFHTLKNGLLCQGFRADKKHSYRIWFTDSSDLSWEVDIVSFGGVADEHCDVACRLRVILKCPYSVLMRP